MFSVRCRKRGVHCCDAASKRDSPREKTPAGPQTPGHLLPSDFLFLSRAPQTMWANGRNKETVRETLGGKSGGQALLCSATVYTKFICLESKYCQMWIDGVYHRKQGQKGALHFIAFQPTAVAVVEAGGAEVVDRLCNCHHEPATQVLPKLLLIRCSKK